MTQNRQCFVMYREENTATWYQAAGVTSIQSEMNHRNAVSTIFEANAFGHFRNGEFLGEFLTIEIHPHAIEARYNAKVEFEYRANTTGIRVRANAQAAELPIVPVEWRKWVLVQNHALHYTGREHDMKPFLDLVTQHQLRLEQGIIIGAEPVPALQIQSDNTERTLGRTAPVQPVQSAKPVAKKSWFNQLLKR